MLAWRHCGFSARNALRVAAEDAEGRKKLAGTMLWALIALAKVTYDAASGSVIYRSKMHARLKRNFQVMAGARSVQLVSALLKNGPQHLAKPRAGLARSVEERGYASLSEMHGCVNLARCPDPAAFERGNYMRILQSWRP